MSQPRKRCGKPTAHHNQSRLGIRQFADNDLTIFEIDGRIAVPIDVLWDWFSEKTNEVTFVIGDRTVVSVYYRNWGSQQVDEPRGLRIVAHELHQPNDARAYTCACFEFDAEDRIVSGGMNSGKHTNYLHGVYSIGPRFKYGCAEPDWVLLSTEGHMMPLGKQFGGYEFAEEEESGEFTFPLGNYPNPTQFYWRKRPNGWQGQNVVTIETDESDPMRIAPALTLRARNYFNTTVHLVQCDQGFRLLTDQELDAESDN